MGGLGHFRYGDDEKKYTKLLRVNGIFQDPRSKIVHSITDNGHGTIHLLLFGKDKEHQRRRIFLKHGAPDWWEMDHIIGGTSGRCECKENLRPMSPDAHRKKHNREVKSPRITFTLKREAAAQEFDRVQGESSD